VKLGWRLNRSVLLLLHEEALKIASLNEGRQDNDGNLEQRPVEDTLVGTLGGITKGGLTSLERYKLRRLDRGYVND